MTQVLDETLGAGELVETKVQLDEPTDPEAFGAIARIDPPPRETTRRSLNGGDELFFKKPNDVDPSIRGALDSSLEFHDVQIGWRHRFRGGTEHATEFTYGRVDTDEGFGNVGAGKFGLHTLQLRSEWTVPLSPAFRVVGGVDVLSSRIDGRYTGIAQPADERDTPIGISGQRTISIAAVEWIQQPGAYLEVGMRPVDKLLLTPGVRADCNEFVGEGSLDPRLSARFEIDDKTALKSGVGRYTGHPQESRVVSPIGNPAIGLAHSTHATVGVERAITESTSVSIEGFGRWMSDMVRPTDGGRPPFYFDDQEGRVFGGEARLRTKPTGRRSPRSASSFPRPELPA